MYILSFLENRQGKLAWGKVSACAALAVAIHGQLKAEPIDAVRLAIWLGVVTASYGIHKTGEWLAAKGATQ